MTSSPLLVTQDRPRGCPEVQWSSASVTPAWRWPESVRVEVQKQGRQVSHWSDLQDNKEERGC